MNDNNKFNDFMKYKNSSGKSSSTPSSGGGIKGLSIFIIAIIGVLWFISILKPKCAAKNCNNTSLDNSIYCGFHKDMYDYKNSYTPKYTTKARTTTKRYSSSYTKKVTQKAAARRNYDYSIKDYDDSEDFYEDNYDDFDGYEDAEDYWDDNYKKKIFKKCQQCRPIRPNPVAMCFVSRRQLKNAVVNAVSNDDYRRKNYGYIRPCITDKDIYAICI